MAANKSNIVDEVSKVNASDRSKYTMSPIMTKYELDQVIGLRMMHLSRGAEPLVTLPDNFKIKSNMEFRPIVQQELLEGQLHFIFKRVHPNGKTAEYWRVSDMDLVSVRHLFR
jgi:hypothetical protein